MFASRIHTAGFAIVAAIGLSACGYNQGYGYGGLGGGIGTGYYDNGFYDDGVYGGGFGGAGFGGLGGGIGSSYFGWNNGFYYPGTGYYVYGRDVARCAGTMCSGAIGRAAGAIWHPANAAI